MPLFTTDFVERSTLDHRILRDSKPPTAIDAILFFGQTHENDRSPLAAIAERWKKYACPVLVGACDPIRNGPFVVRGSDTWVQDLMEYGVDRDSIIVYPMSKKFPPSTDAEAWGMIEAGVGKFSWKKLVITVNPLHAVRAFVTLLSACVKNGLEDVCIWSALSDWDTSSETSSPWDEDVCYSGGQLKTSRENHIVVDATKLMTYCLKGDHLTARQVLEYLRSRQAMSRRLKTTMVSGVPIALEV